MANIELHSNVKKLEQTSAPNSIQLPDGNICFGLGEDGKPIIYGNIDNIIHQLNKCNNAQTSVPVGGSIIWYGTEESIPKEYMREDGRELNKSEYPLLFSRIGYTYGGSEDKFNIPDSRGKVLVHVNENDDEFNTLGKEFGEKKHQLIIAELAKHRHSLNPNGKDYANYSGTFGGGGVEFVNPTQNSAHTVGEYIGYTGGNEPHNNIQPSLSAFRIIKVKPDVYSDDIIDLNDKVEALQNKLNNIQVGATNLLRQTKTFDNPWDITSSQLTPTKSEYKGFTVLTQDSTTTTREWENIIQQSLYPEKKGQEYILSFYAKGNTDESELWTYFYGDTNYIGTTTLDNSSDYKVSVEHRDGRCKFTLSTEWKRYYVHYRLKDAGDLSVLKHILFRVYPGYVVSIYAPKLELGNIPTDWSPSPQDVEDKLNAVQDQINTMNTTLTKLDTNLGDLTIEVIDEW